MQELICAILEVDDDTDVSGFGRDTTAKWDSLAQVAIINGMEDVFDLEIDLKEYESLSSYGALETYLDKTDQLARRQDRCRQTGRAGGRKDSGSPGMAFLWPAGRYRVGAGWPSVLYQVFNHRKYSS